MYISWLVFVVIVVVTIAAISLCIYFARRSKCLRNIISKLEGNHEGKDDSDDSDWGDGEGMS